jgi:hypothetical protein
MPAQAHVIGIFFFLFLLHNKSVSKGKGNEKRILNPSNDNILIGTPPPVFRDGRSR